MNGLCSSLVCGLEMRREYTECDKGSICVGVSNCQGICEPEVAC